MTDCQGFAWIGQPMTSCDRCGRPAWDHDYDEHWGGDLAPFGTGGWLLVPWPSKLIGSWLERGHIGRERAAALLSATPPPEATSTPQESGTVPLVVRVYDTAGAMLREIPVPASALQSGGTNADMAEITDRTDLALLFAAPDCCPWDCDRCNEPPL